MTRNANGFGVARLPTLLFDGIKNRGSRWKETRRDEMTRRDEEERTSSASQAPTEGAGRSRKWVNGKDQAEAVQDRSNRRERTRRTRVCEG